MLTGLLYNSERHVKLSGDSQTKDTCPAQIPDTISAWQCVLYREVPECMST